MTLLELTLQYNNLQYKIDNVKSQSRKLYYQKKQHELTLKYRLNQTKC